jgi:V/A-type H+-transporting ATPase subunit I
MKLLILRLINIVLYRMLRPERMTFASIICTKKDVEELMQALNSFGEFHIEEAAQKDSEVDYGKSIQKVEQSLSDVEQLSKQLIVEKGGLLDLFREEEPVKVEVTAENWEALSDSTCQHVQSLKETVNDLNNSLSSLREKDESRNHTKSILTILRKTNTDLAALEEMHLIHIAIASIPHKNLDPLITALKPYPVILQSRPLNKNEDFISVAAPSKAYGEIERILKIHHAAIFEIPQYLPHNVDAALKAINNQLKRNLEDEKAVLEHLHGLGIDNRNNLAAWRETEQNILALLQAEKKILYSGRLAIVKGFVPTHKFNELSQKVNRELGGKALVLQNTEAQPQGPPPTKISHGRFVAPFQEITKLYGLPEYEEVDPTPFMAITFPLIFGLMFGDIGHGLILLVGGLTVGFLIKKNQTIKNVCWILAACGAAAIIAGALFGEFFGSDKIFQPLWFSPFTLGGTNAVFKLLVFSLLVGVVQIMSGLVLELVNYLLKHNVADALLTAAPKIAFYASAVYVIIVYQLNFAKWFPGPVLLMIVPFLVLVAGKPVYLSTAKLSVRHSVQTEGGKAQGENSVGQRIFEGGDMVTRLLSNSISYTRILALLMAHWALLYATYAIVGLVGTASILAVIASGIIVVVGNIFVMALEGLIVFIHTLRLHFYEWFSKFYQDSGLEFKAFKQHFIYTNLILKRKQT